MEEDYVAESERLYEEQATLDALGISRTPLKADIVITGKMGEEPSRSDGQQELTEALAASRTPGAMAPMTAQEAGQEFAAGGRAVLGGVRDAAQGFVDMTGELGEYLEGQFPLGYITLDDEGLGYRSQRPKDMQEIKFPEVPKGEGLPENLARGITQFIAGMAMSPIGKGAGYLQFTKRAAWAESLFDPEQGNTATALKQFGLEGPVLDLLDSKVGEDADAAERLTARLQQATTGAIEGAVIDGLIAGIRAARTDEGLVETIRRGLAGAGQKAASVTRRAGAATETLEPVVIESPDAEPFDRSQLPPRMDRPERQPAEIDELGFAIKSLEVVKNLQQKRGTVEQFMKRLKQNGVSEEEIQALGLREKFNDPSERITRDQLAQAIRDRRIELEESVKTTEPSELAEGEISDLRFGQGEVLEEPDEWNWRTEEYILGLQRGSDPDEYEQVIDEVERRGRYDAEELARLREQIEAGDFTALPNSIQSEFEDAADDVAREMYLDNPVYRYRALDEDYEILGNEDLGYFVRYEGQPISNDQHSSLGEAEIVAREDAYNRGLLSDAGDFGEAKFEEYMLPGGENYREILLRDPEKPTGGSRSHWSEDDVIGHVLVKDRIDAEGNRTLYAEEVQSDFAQSARPSSAEKRRIEVNENGKNRTARAISSNERQIAVYQKRLNELKDVLETATDPDVIADLRERIRFVQDEINRTQASLNKDRDAFNDYQDTIYQYNREIALRAERVGKTRFVKDTQQWLRPTMKRLIARAIEEGYDSVSVPPYQVVHERWNEDYGDFYRKSVPNTLLKVARQLDPNAKLEYSDLVDSAFPELRDEAAKRDLRPDAKGLDRTPTIVITPAMREAYKEKGQSLFVPGAAVVIAGKLVADQMKGEENGNTN